MDAILTFIEVVRWFEVCGNGVQGPPAAAFIQAKTTARILQIDFIGRFRRWPIRIEDSTRVTRLTLTQEWWFSRGDTMKLGPAAAVVDGSDDDDDSPPGIGDKTAFRRAFSQPNSRTSRAMASATLRLGVIASARRTVNLTSRLDRGSSLATPAFQAVHSRKSVRAFASENC